MARQADRGYLPDLAGFATEIDGLRGELRKNLTREDVSHLKKVERVGWTLKLVGYLTAWWLPNPLSILCLGLGQTTRWGTAQHVLHR